MPLTLGGLGVGGASRMCVGQTVWRWCKTGIPTSPTQSWEGWPPAHQGIYLRAVQESGDRLRGGGVQVPSWEALAAGLRPEDVDMEPEPSQPKHGWQKFASTIQNVHRDCCLAASMDVDWRLLQKG